MPGENDEADVGVTIRPIRLVPNPEIRRIERPGAAGDERHAERRALAVIREKD